MAKKKHKTEDDFFEIPKYAGCGVYAIISIEDFKCYVGSTSNIKTRAYHHKTALITGKHTNRGLQEAHDEKKILRFIILQRIECDIDKDVLLMLEYFYMLQMKYKCFDLYNEVPKTGCYKNQIEALKINVLGKLDGIISASKNIEKSLEKECGSKSGYLRKTKYREWGARREINKGNNPKTKI